MIEYWNNGWGLKEISQLEVQDFVPLYETVELLPYPRLHLGRVLRGQTMPELKEKLEQIGVNGVTYIPSRDKEFPRSISCISVKEILLIRKWIIDSGSVFSEDLLYSNKYLGGVFNS